MRSIRTIAYFIKITITSQTLFYDLGYIFKQPVSLFCYSVKVSACFVDVVIDSLLLSGQSSVMTATESSEVHSVRVQ